jgi:hypothetical protein
MIEKNINYVDVNHEFDSIRAEHLILQLLSFHKNRIEIDNEYQNCIMQRYFIDTINIVPLYPMICRDDYENVNDPLSVLDRFTTCPENQSYQKNSQRIINYYWKGDYKTNTIVVKINHGVFKNWHLIAQAHLFSNRHNNFLYKGAFIILSKQTPDYSPFDNQFYLYNIQSCDHINCRCQANLSEAEIILSSCCRLI